MKKELMLGNEAVARGLYEAGARVVSSYPGTPSTEITEAAASYEEIYCEWAPNEKVAMEVAAGASFGGARSFCGMKHVGLNVAADPLFTMSYIGVNGGMVIGVADDPGMHSSQNEQDSRRYAKAAKVPMLEPADSAECRDFAKLAFSLSEEFDTPVILRLTTRIAHSRSIVPLGEREERPLLPYEKALAQQRGDHQFPALARVLRLERLVVNDFRQERILCKMQAAAVFAFAGDARPAQFRHAIVICDKQPQVPLDAFAHPLGAALRAQQADAQPVGLRRVAGFADHLAQIHRVRRRRHQARHAEVAEHHQLFFRIAGRRRDDRCADALKAVVQPQRARKQAVAK